MKYQRLLLLILLLLTSLVACSAGHSGESEIAFIRDGHLWTIDPNGANAFEVVSQNTPVLGYGWSPNHHILFFRTLDSTFAQTKAGKNIVYDPLTGLAGDLPAGLNTISIDGGTPIPIVLPGSDITESNAWWSPDGTRLLYREGFISSSSQLNTNTVTWWMSQNDQPASIARKLLPNSFSIPSLGYDSRMAIGNSSNGIFTTTFAGTDQHFIGHGQLSGHPLPATLERVLWQPGHAQPHFLYAVSQANGQNTTNTLLTLQLMLSDLNGQSTMLTTCTCAQFAWSSDGNHVLYNSGAHYTILNLDGSTYFTFTGEEGSVPYWSPDGQYLLLDGLHSLQLVLLKTKHDQIVLRDDSGIQSSIAASSMPGTTTLLQPVTNSPWSADSQQFLFLTHNRLVWQGKTLSSGKGLYTVTIDVHGNPQGTPGIVDNGNDLQAGWSYEDPNTSFLF